MSASQVVVWSERRQTLALFEGIGGGRLGHGRVLGRMQRVVVRGRGEAERRWESEVRVWLGLRRPQLQFRRS